MQNNKDRRRKHACDFQSRENHSTCKYEGCCRRRYVPYSIIHKHNTRKKNTPPDRRSALTFDNVHINGSFHRDN